MRIAETPPAFCSFCYGSHPERRHVDLMVDLDTNPVLDKETGVIATSSDGSVLANGDTVMCEACARELCELIDLKPEKHRRQLREIKRLELRVDYWRDRALHAQAELGRQLTAEASVV